MHLSNHFRPRSDATECGIWSESRLLAMHPAVFQTCQLGLKLTCSNIGQVWKYGNQIRCQIPRINIWASTGQNLQNGMCAQRSLRSDWASAQSDQSLLFAQWVAKDPCFLHADSEDWSDRADAQADLSLCWAHMPFCRFCPTLAPMPYCSKKAQITKLGNDLLFYFFFNII